MNNLELLKQCQQWFEQYEIQKVIDAIEALPISKRTPELDSELAKAYLGLAQDNGSKFLCRKALELLVPLEKHFSQVHSWNYRIASAYYFLDELGPALHYFEKALEALPNDADTEHYINDCRNRLALPSFEKNFCKRTQEAWVAFSQIEAELRQIMDTDKTRQRGNELIEKCRNALKMVLCGSSFELGFNGQKYELILSPEGLRSRLFPLVYFQKQAPKSVLEHWNIWVGRQPCENLELKCGNIKIRAEDVQVWAEKTEDQKVNLVLYCEKLTPILKDTNQVWWALSMLLDLCIGEVSSIAYIAGFDIYAKPKDEQSILLSELPKLLQSMGFSLNQDASDYLENSYIEYAFEPSKDPQSDWRLDIYRGSCRLPVLINDYLDARTNIIDEYHRDGIVAGFICYPLGSFSGKNRNETILDFNNKLRETISRYATDKAITFLGQATGLYYAYLDFIAWDLTPVLDATQEFFSNSEVPYAYFHSFRRNVGGVYIENAKNIEPDVHEDTGSLLSAEDIKTLEYFDEGHFLHSKKIIKWLEDFIKNGVEEKRFTEKQAHEDLQIGLWYAFASNNLCDYIQYYRSAEWLKNSEKNAAKCGTWYYRYCVALIYCGRLNEALEYAEKGTQQEPNYPWNWLELGKLRAHFGDKSGALFAVKKGLELQPGNYEFLTLQKEINEGATLEQMESHLIDPDFDKLRQQGIDKGMDEKIRALACIRVNETGLADFYELFKPNRFGYKKNSPICEFLYPVKEHFVELSFRMNEAGLSKMGTEWMRQLKKKLDSGDWMTHTPKGEPEGILKGVFVDQSYHVSLVYQQPGNNHFQLCITLDETEFD